MSCTPQPQGGLEGDNPPSSPIKTYKLNIHTSQFCTEELVIRNEDFPDVRQGDVLEFYHEEETFSRLLLQVTSDSLYPENKLSRAVPKDTVYILKSIAESFHLSNYKSLVVNKVVKEDVALDSVELLFKEQYLGRSEMWRLKKSLIDSVVFLKKKIGFSKDSVRCDVSEMWGRGDRVACGFITPDTKVVFRSTTAMVYLFIQMSSEMWDFDLHGDLYFEKAVNGFLYEMFSKWQRTGASHEVTIVLFSRVFYEAEVLAEFPDHMRDCLQQDYRGRFYEDFYRVVVQNEKFDDWFPTLTLLRQTLVDYEKLVLSYHARPGLSIPQASLSTAAQGNFLEVLNISLNTFEKHFINRNLDRTGQQAIVITPGVGIFEVDRDLNIITKQRIIDSGVGSDLICVGEQPLHAVPLFKIHSRRSELYREDDYLVPHWINLSFYHSDKKLGYSTFKPRIKLPPLKNPEEQKKTTCYFPPSITETNPPDTAFGYDEYDARVFELPRTKNMRTRTLTRSSMTGSSNNITSPKKERESDKSMRIPSKDDSSVGDYQSRSISPRKMSSAISIPSNTSSHVVSGHLDHYSKTYSGHYKGKAGVDRGRHTSDHFDTVADHDSDSDEILDQVSSSLTDKPVWGSAGVQSDVKNYLQRPGRALVNPFDPSNVTVKLTSNRRRWTHIFPQGPSSHVPHHHKRHVSRIDSTQETGGSPASSCSGTMATLNRAMDSTFKKIADYSVGERITGGGSGKKLSDADDSGLPRHRVSVTDQVTRLGSLMWGVSVSGDQVWDATLTTGVDWKSITWPACLPITTDYFPDKRAFENDYVFNQYVIVPDEINSDHVSRSPLQKSALTTREVFLELVGQRLSQGFQLIINPKDDLLEIVKNTSSKHTQNQNSTISNLSLFLGSKSVVNIGSLSQNSTEHFWLSIGKNFHHLSLTGSTIDVVIYRPRHPYPSIDYHYNYRLMAPDNDTYEMSWVEFNMEKLENYSWNYLDHYVCTRGDQDFVLSENLKYWRFRMYVLPLKPFIPFTKSILDGCSDMKCDVYTRPSPDEYVNLAEGFMRFVETSLNKIKRPTANATDRRKSRCNTMAVGDMKPPLRGDQGFRDRVSSSSHGLSRPRIDKTALRDRVVSGPVNQDNLRKRTESGGTGVRVREADNLRPLIQTLSGIETGNIGSQDSVFSSGVGSVSNLESQDQKDFKLLRSSCTIQEILDAMLSPSTGLTFINKNAPLPSTTFVSAEAILWLMEHVESVASERRAISIMEDMLARNMIRHASGDSKFRFLYGFYLYYMVEKDNNSSSYLGDKYAFNSDWIEVGLELFRPERDDMDSGNCLDEGTNANFLQENIRRFSGNIEDFKKPNTYKDYEFKSFTLDIDSGNKSERPEWGEGKYQGKYRPDKAFELRVKWSVATGALIAELVSNWARKAQSNGLSIIPIPGDPFALPSQNSDPIRGPIYVELDTVCIRKEGNNLFQDFAKESWDQRLFLFRESIVKRFGFVACSTDPALQISSATFSTHHQYIHCTGNCFVLIPTRLDQVSGIQGIKKGMTDRKKAPGVKVLIVMLNHY